MNTTRLDAIKRLSDLAHAKLPTELHGRLERGTALVLHEMIEPCADGTYRVMNNAGTRFYEVNGSCTCTDYAQAPDGLCKHRLGVMMLKRLDGLRTKDETGPAGHDTAPESSQGQDAIQGNLEPSGGIPEALRPFITHLHGKPFVQYAGLLALAHERGLVSLKAHLISVTPELALAEAEATFADGRSFGECADATPANVNVKIRAHVPRMALTRAKARCLRDALNIGIVAVEELGEE
jgi:hypothetical protein